MGGNRLTAAMLLCCCSAWAACAGNDDVEAEWMSGDSFDDDDDVDVDVVEVEWFSRFEKSTAEEARCMCAKKFGVVRRFKVSRVIFRGGGRRAMTEINTGREHTAEECAGGGKRLETGGGEVTERKGREGKRKVQNQAEGIPKGQAQK